MASFSSLNLTKSIGMAVLLCLAPRLIFWAQDEKPSSPPSFDYDIVRQHEIKPHRRTIPLAGLSSGLNQLHLTLTVSPAGYVTGAEAEGDEGLLKFWPQLETEVREWRFTPFEQNGKAVTAQIEEYLDLVPPERKPKTHVDPPVVRPNSKVAITLSRSGCFGSCPSYIVTLSTEGIAFEGQSFIVAPGKHRDFIDPDEVRSLAKRFVAADFYSMDSEYVAGVTDNPTYSLSISIGERTKKVEDYVGSWVGMPSVISDLEQEVDSVAKTERWIEGDTGLVEALKSERFNFQTFQAQTMLKAAATRAKTETVQQLLAAGVPLEPLPAPKAKDPNGEIPIAGWLTSASAHSETLQLLIAAGASRSDQKDKDLALVGAARSGSVESVRALIAYGANPNANLSKLAVIEAGNGWTSWSDGSGSILIYAARSGNPEVVREILRYHPKINARDRKGQTALFAAGEYLNSDKDGARVAIVRLLVEAGADVNGHDNDGNTPLHETFLTDVEVELLKLGADVNARNNDGETPIFTTVDDAAIPIFLAHGADLNIRNNKGETVLEAAEGRGPARQEALRRAIREMPPREQ